MSKFLYLSIISYLFTLNCFSLGIKGYFCNLKLKQKKTSTPSFKNLDSFSQDFLHYRNSKETRHSTLFLEYKKSVESMIDKVLAPYLKGELELSYEQLLKTQHKSLQTEGYRGYYQGFHESIDRIKVINSKFIFDIKDYETPKLPLYRKYNLKKGEDMLDYLKDSYGEIEKTIKIKKIPKAELPTNKKITAFEKFHFKKEFHLSDTQADKLFDHTYPRAEALKLYYLPRMQELFLKLKSSYQNLSDYDFLILLADYYHVAINSHIFLRMNNSIFMSHLNSFLILKGYAGVSHQYLDYWALSYSYQNFRKILINTILEQKN